MASAAAKKRSYRTPGVVNGSLAYDFNTLERRLESSLEQELYVPPREESAAEVISKAREQTKAQIRAPEWVSPAAVAGFAVLTLLLAALVFSYVELMTIGSSVVTMQNQLTALQAEQVSLQARYEQAFDLTNVKEAATAAGMVQPSDSQLYYIDLSTPDNATVYREAAGGGAKDVLGLLFQAIQMAVEYFR